MWLCCVEMFHAGSGIRRQTGVKAGICGKTTKDVVTHVVLESEGSQSHYHWIDFRQTQSHKTFRKWSCVVIDLRMSGQIPGHESLLYP